MRRLSVICKCTYMNLRMYAVMSSDNLSGRIWQYASGQNSVYNSMAATNIVMSLVPHYAIQERCITRREAPRHNENVYYIQLKIFIKELNDQIKRRQACKLQK